MPVQAHPDLSKRENQAMEILLRLGSATAAQVQEELPEAPSYSSVRSLLGILVEKGLAKIAQDGKRYVYEPAKSPARMRKAAVARLLRTFFEGSAGALAASLLDPKEAKLSADEVASLRQLLDQHES